MSLDHPVVVFDGVCNFCSASVQLIIKNDKAGVIRFASTQSAAGSQLMRSHGLDPSDAKSFLFVSEGRAFTRSDAALEVAGHLPFPWNVLPVLRLLPRVLRDGGYGVLARNRYRWFGKRDICFVPNSEERARFLD